MQPRYRGLLLVPTRAAMREMAWLSIDMHECKRILEYGKPAPRKRAMGTEEKWLSNKKKTHNVVIVKDYSVLHHEEVWLITHVGTFTDQKIA